MKFKYYFVALIIVILLIAGCAGAHKVVKTNSEESIPEWVKKPPKAEDAIYAIGQSEKASPALAQKAADARAIQGIGEQMSLVVKSMVNDFLLQSGAGDDAEINELTESVAKLISESKLIGVRIKQRDVSGNKWYSLAEYKISDASAKINQTLIEEAKSKKAIYNKIEAKIGFNELEKEIEKSFGKN